MKLQVKILKLVEIYSFAKLWPILVFLQVGILIAGFLLITSLTNRAKLERDEIRKADLAKLSKLAEAYFVMQKPPELPARNSNSHISTDGTPPQDAKGSGWIPADFSQQVSSLLVDPINDGVYFYRYYSDPNPTSSRFKLDAALEADFEAAKNDGGVDPSRYEVGTDKSLLPP